MAEANNNNDAAVTIARLTAQLKKLNEANGKYKQLLKLAKERIEKQEQEQQATISNSNATTTDTKQVVAVCQRIQHADQIWALLEWEIVPENEHDVFLSDHPRFLEWKSFPEESALHDFIRRDTGEPLPIPPYSYSPEQSLQIQQEAQAQVAAVTEEFRKFRIQTELAMQQQRATNSEARRNHTTHPSRATSHPPPTPSTQQQQQQQQQQQIEQLQAELQLQDTQWKQAYDVLLAENKALKSTGSEALLASQWRQRRLQNLQTEDRYEAKYRDLKESFKLYRKKAKEILEQQHQQQQQNEPGSLSSSSSSSSSDAKLSYLKNLLLQYFLADDDSTRRPMEGAIGMVLQFSPAETQQIEAKRAEKDSWF